MHHVQAMRLNNPDSNCIHCECYYFAAGMGVKYCDDYVCLFVCLLAYLRNHTTQLHQFFRVLPATVAWSYFDGVMIENVLPVLWVTSWFHTKRSTVYS